MFYRKQNRISINPIFRITLPPHTQQEFYLQASSHITTLIVKINLWNDLDAFFKKEIHYQFILALFFGAMGVIIFYNLLIYLSTKKLSYLYYVLFFMAITLHQLIYKGVMSLYLLPPETMRYLVEFSSLIVALPALFLSLFTQTILDLRQYPRLYRILNGYLILFPFLILLIYKFHLHAYRNIPAVVLLMLLFFITTYALFRRNKQAYFIIIGWLLFLTSGLFMYLSSLGIYDIFSQVPYYTEIALVAESLIFSFSLAARINQLNREKILLQHNLIDQQKKEQQTLSKQVAKQTAQLKKSLEEKELLLKELNHRVKNSIQTIVAFLRLQIDEINDKKIANTLKTLEHRVMAISHLYALLYTRDHLSFVNTYEYFVAIIEDIERTYHPSSVSISLEVETHIKSEYAIYCGFILNEAINNAFEHAFPQDYQGKILIKLKEQKGSYTLTIKDNGIGYNKGSQNNTLGITIIETLVITQLGGVLHTNTDNGVEIIITWSENEKR